MHLLADATMPLVSELTQYLAQALAPSGQSVQLTTFTGRQPSAAQLAQAEVLLIRSITQVDAALLQQAPHLRWVGTATIGTEHVDAHACQAAGVTFVSTPGVNANAVGDYVVAAVSELALRDGQLPTGDVAIIGAGHTGRAAGQRLQGLGLRVHYYDPPLVQSWTPQKIQQEPLDIHADWQRVLASQVISCHVPLVHEGRFPTHHLFDVEAIARLQAGTILINASRGAVVAEEALRQAMHRQQELRVVLDVWEHEPQIAPDLLPWLSLATPHIAGHSVIGKVAGTWQLFAQLLQFIRRDDIMLPPVEELLAPWPAATRRYHWHTETAPSWQMLASWVREIYDIRDDDAQLRQAPSTAAAFDQLRRTYQTRGELSQGTVTGGDWLQQAHWQQRLQQLNFLPLNSQEQ